MYTFTPDRRHMYIEYKLVIPWSYKYYKRSWNICNFANKEVASSIRKHLIDGVDQIKISFVLRCKEFHWINRTIA